jgi:riboflavin kinase/FMN adenylyltransferase
MEIFKTLENLKPAAKGAVIVIGNFDGVHRGHRVILEKAAALAKTQKRALGLLTFEPHPRGLFQPDASPYRITTPDLKAKRLEQAGVDLLFSLKFDWDFASQSADDFINHVLIKGLGAAHVVVGYDFKFGQLRKGTPEHIKSAGITVTVVEEVQDEGEGELSSSRIRQLIRQGEIGKANELLGWDWEMRGIIEKGDQRGREIGYPTANFALGDIVHPAYGVYAAHVQIEGESEWRGAAINIGIRPMFEISTARVESYIFDFNAQIYGRLLRVRPVERLRSEAKFNSLDALTDQIEKDCQQARGILKL